jgi:hypothetical protein
LRTVRLLLGEVMMGGTGILFSISQ